MTTQSSQQLTAHHCVPCEGGVSKYSLEEAHSQLQALSGWQLSQDGRRIRKDWVVRDFEAGVEFFQKVARLAEEEGHHPDLHLEDYRHLWIELWTHAIGGLSQNDFILAAKIDQLPIAVRPSDGQRKPR